MNSSNSYRTIGSKFFLVAFLAGIVFLFSATISEVPHVANDWKIMFRPTPDTLSLFMGVVLLALGSFFYVFDIVIVESERSDARTSLIDFTLMPSSIPEVITKTESTTTAAPQTILKNNYTSLLVAERKILEIIYRSVKPNLTISEIVELTSSFSVDSPSTNEEWFNVMVSFNRKGLIGMEMAETGQVKIILSPETRIFLRELDIPVS